MSLIKFISTYVVTTFWHKIKGNMGSLVSRFPGRVLGRPSALMSPLLDCVGEDLPSCDRYMTPSNPTFWRNDPIFTPPIEEDIAASTGFWLLEHSTDVSVASAVPQHSSTSCGYHIIPPRPPIRLRDTYMGCFRVPQFGNSAPLKALQKRPSSLPPDLFLHIHGEEWGGDALLSDVVLAAQEGWLRLPNLRPTLEGLDFPRRLHNVGIETCHPDHQLSFLETIEILSG